MTNIQNLLITVSLLGWLIAIIIKFIQYRRNKSYWIVSIVQCVIIVISMKFLNRYFGYFSDIQEYGTFTLHESVILGGSYLSMVLGMIAHHIFIQVNMIEEQKKGRKRKFRWFPLVMPLAISPLVFIPVLGQLQTLGAQATTFKTIVMQFLLAFQNGFFWKTIFEQMQRKFDKREK